MQGTANRLGATSVRSRGVEVLVAAPLGPARTLVERALTRSGMTVRGADNVPEIFEVLGEISAPRLIVLDEGLAPQTVAHQLCERIAALSLRPAPQVILLRSPDRGDALPPPDAPSLGDVLTKPVDPLTLVHRLQRLVRVRDELEARRREESRLTRVRRMASFASWEWSLETDEFRCDSELLEMFQCRRLEGGAQVEELLQRVHPANQARVNAAWRERRPHRLEYRLTLPNTKKPRIVQQEAELAQDEADGEVRVVGVVQDITPLKEAERRVSRLAYFDSLTGLPNRAFMNEHLLRTIAAARRYKHRFAVMGIDLDLFKRINDTMGHAAGDQLLKEVARRISASVRGVDLVVQTGTLDLGGPPGDGSAVARLGGDEFIVVLSQLRGAEDASLVARRIADALAVGVNIDGNDVFIGCSIGIALYPENGETPGALLKHADAAMYQAKEKGRNNFQFFEESMNQMAQRRLDLETGIRSALAEGAFLLHYQPKVDLETGATIGVEALLRWPRNGAFVSPAEFVPVAEDTGLIVPLGEWVLRTACRQAKAWLDAGWELPVAINVSGRQFREAGLPALVASVLAEYGLPPHLLEVEITEGVIMQDSATGIEMLGQLKALGVKLALDDFGTGYSSLSYLSRFPIDTLKIDRSFVKGLGHSKSSDGIAAAIIALARTLSLSVVAEGVDAPAQIEFLQAHGCRTCQGFAFSPAVPGPRVAKLYRASFSP